MMSAPRLSRRHPCIPKSYRFESTDFASVMQPTSSVSPVWYYTLYLLLALAFPLLCRRKWFNIECKGMHVTKRVLRIYRFQFIQYLEASRHSLSWFVWCCRVCSRLILFSWILLAWVDRTWPGYCTLSSKNVRGNSLSLGMQWFEKWK